jgi:hypothetical protein
MGKIYLAGAESVFAHDEIKKAFNSLDMEIDFAEAIYMKKYFPKLKNSDFKFFNSAEEMEAESKIIPLSEFWISECIKNKERSFICNTALKASRSKKFFYEILKTAGNKVPMIFETKEDAEKFILNGGELIVKPDGLFSGYGIKTVTKENFHNFEKFIFNASNIKNRAIKLFEIKNSSALACEKIKGTEYSADCFFINQKVNIVRICKKEIVNIHGTPCTATCALVNSTEEISDALSRWCNALFEKENISFAQFDFIIDTSGNIFPIDFAPRVGGGMKELLENYEINLYANAVLGKEYSVKESNTFLTQFNYLPVKSGILNTDDFNLIKGKTFIFKHKGDFVPECPTSVASRVAVVVAEHSAIIEQQTIDSLLIKEDKIDFWK